MIRSYTLFLLQGCFVTEISPKCLSFSWRATEGNGSLCDCCDSDCVGLSGEKTSGAEAQPETGYFFFYSSLQPTVFVKVVLTDCVFCCNLFTKSCDLLIFYKSTGKKHEADRTVGPLHTLQRSYWSGRMSVNHWITFTTSELGGYRDWEDKLLQCQFSFFLFKKKYWLLDSYCNFNSLKSWVLKSHKESLLLPTKWKLLQMWLISDYIHPSRPFC